MLRRFGQLAATAALLLLAVALIGCGSNGDEETSGPAENPEAVEAQKAEAERAGRVKSGFSTSDVVRAFPPQIVKDGDVNAEDEGTPERALLEWWQAVQFNDARRAQELTSEAVLEEIGEDVFAEWAGTQSLPGIAILGSSRDGGEAVIQAGMLSFQPDESGEVPDQPTNSQPDSFAMTREGGEWVYDELEFLLPKVENL